MMKKLGFFIISLVYSMTLWAMSSSNHQDDNQGLHLNWLDKSIAPGTNFFKFANGTWQKNNPIPDDYARYGVFQKLQKQNQERIHELLERIAKNARQKPGSIEQKIGDFYFSGMNEVAINETGIKPLQPEFDRINHIKNLTDLQNVITHLQIIGVDALFRFTQMQDFKDSSKVIGVACQGGIGLPDRDYYLKNEPKFQRIRELYTQHIIKMFSLLGDDLPKAAAEAKTIMRIETILAKASMSRIEQRDPHAVYHLMNLAQLQQATPYFSWERFFIAIGHPEIKQINLAMPIFFNVMNEQLKTITLDDWKIYLRWHLIDAFAPLLSQPFVDEDFRMISALTGVKKLLSRWERVVNVEDQALGFAVGKRYVEAFFPPSSKENVQVILNHIRHALRNDLQTLSWMTPKTRQAAIKKLGMMRERIGYPDKWRDYSALMIDRGPYILNVIRANIFLYQYEINKIGKPVDETEWEMTPQTVNAYYDPSMNRLNIPAGLLQPPFFDPKAPAAVNYGAVGFVLGHEMTHGFDDQGAQFDGKGNLNDWWTSTDLKKFQAATQCIANQFSQYTVDGNVHVQGKLVTGEATADLGGLILAYRAFQSTINNKQAKTIGGFTADQQFFLGAAHVWASNTLPEEARRLVVIDPHPPALYRVNGTLANMPQFQAAYHLPANSPMVKNPRCVIW